MTSSSVHFWIIYDLNCNRLLPFTYTWVDRFQKKDCWPVLLQPGQFLLDYDRHSCYRERSPMSSSYLKLCFQRRCFHMMVTGATLALDFAAGVFAEMYIWKEYRNYHFLYQFILPIYRLGRFSRHPNLLCSV